jgi:tRNA A-37 threonylcarbamoyl transferase component Bud32
MTNKPVKIKNFYGFSGTKVHLYEDTEKFFVRKFDTNKRNIPRILSLKNILNLPKIYNIEENYYDMEYIHGLDLKNYLYVNNEEKLIKFIIDSLNKLSEKSLPKNYTSIYEKYLNKINFKNHFKFTKKDLIKKLPKVLPQTQYHGDFTLENLIFSNNKFYFIDPLESEFDSYVFDFSKLRQDLDIYWLVRDNNQHLKEKLDYIKIILSRKFKLMNNKYLFILMLIRVFKYVTDNSF